MLIGSFFKMLTFESSPGERNSTTDSSNLNLKLSITGEREAYKRYTTFSAVFLASVIISDFPLPCSAIYFTK